MSTTATTITSNLHGDLAPTTLAFVAASPTSQDALQKGPADPARPFVRPYNPGTDHDGIEAVFRQVYTPLYRFAGLTTIAFIVFCRAYLDVAPQTCHVLLSSDADAPKILGYIVGTPETPAFCAAFAANRGSCREDIEAVPAAPRVEEMRDPELRARCMEYFRQRNAWVSTISSGARVIEDIVFSGAKKELEGRYEAHFHMAIAPERQGSGLGSRLVSAFEEGLRGSGVSGMFAAVPVGNDAARKLYRKCGFRALKAVDRKEVGIVGGGEGEMEGKILMVKRWK